MSVASFKILLSRRCVRFVSSFVHKDLSVLHHGDLFTFEVKIELQYKELMKPFHSNQTTGVCLSFLCPLLSRKEVSYRSNLGNPEVRACAQGELHKGTNARLPVSLLLPLNLPYGVHKKQHHGENRESLSQRKTALTTYTLENAYGVLVTNTTLHRPGCINQQRCLGTMRP